MTVSCAHWGHIVLFVMCWAAFADKDKEKDEEIIYKLGEYDAKHSVKSEVQVGGIVNP